MNQQPMNDPGKGMATASFILGIVGICLTFFNSLLGIILGIIGVVCAEVSQMKSRSLGLPKSSFAMIGSICSIMAIVIAVGWIVIFNVLKVTI